MNSRQWVLVGATKQIARGLKAYKRPAERAKAATKLQQEIAAICSQYVPRSSSATTARAGYADTACDAAQGAGGVCDGTCGLKANSFTPFGTNSQCFSETEPVTVFWEVEAMLAERAEPEKKPDPEWPVEAEVLITGECPNPRLLVGCLWQEQKRGARVSLWKGWRLVKIGSVVKCVLERGGRDALYRQVGA